MSAGTDATSAYLDYAAATPMTHELGLSGIELLVYARVLSFCTTTDGTYYESRARCAEFLGTSVRQVVRAFARLCEGGLIEDVGVRCHAGRQLSSG